MGQQKLPVLLADAIAVIAAGRVIAEGTPDELKSLAGGDRIVVVLRAAGDLVPAARLLQARLRVDVRADRDSRELSLPVTDRLAALTEIIGSLREEGITAEDIGVRRPTLDEAFLHLTGQQPPAGGGASPSWKPAEVDTQ
jgi:ABC-2 type transport system ATP-binding protein